MFSNILCLGICKLASPLASLCNFMQDVRRRGVPAAVRGDVLSDKRRRNKRGRDDDWYLPVIESVTRQRV